MEGGDQALARSDGDDFAIVFADGLDAGAVGGDDGSADKDAGDAIGKAGEADGVLERVNLGTEGVSPDHNVEEAEAELVGAAFNFARHENHSHAGAPDGEARLVGVAERRFEAGAAKEHADGGAFAARDDEALNGREVGFVSHFNPFGAGPLHRFKVPFKVALKGQYAYSHASSLLSRQVHSRGD